MTKKSISQPVPAAEATILFKHQQAAILLTYHQVAAQLGVSRSQVNRYVARKKLKVVDLGHCTKRFRPADVDRFIARQAGDVRPEY